MTENINPGGDDTATAENTAVEHATLATTVTAGDLLPVTARFARLIGAKNYAPETPQVSLSSGGDHLNLRLHTWGSLDVEVQVAIPGESTGTGAVGMDARRFNKVVKGIAPAGTSKAAKAAPLTLRRGDNDPLEIVGDVTADVDVESRAPITIDQTKPGGDPFNWLPLGELNVEQLGEAWETVKRSVCNDETLPIFTSVLFRFHADELVLATTDRFRLGVHRLPGKFNVDGTDGGEMKLLVFARQLEFVHDLLRMTGAETASLSCSDGAGALRIESGRVTATIRLLDADFPKVDPLIPRTATTVVEVDRKGLIEKVKQVARAAAGRVASVCLEAEGDTLTLRPHGWEEGVRITGKMPATVSGENKMVAFDPVYLVDAAMSATGDRVAIALTEPNRPGLVLEADHLEGLEMAKPDKGVAVPTPLPALPTLVLLMPVRLPS